MGLNIEHHISEHSSTPITLPIVSCRAPPPTLFYPPKILILA